MSLESDYAREIATRYEKSGWVVSAPEEAIQQIAFAPDLLLKKGDRRLVIEIKKEGFTGSRATDTLKKIIETDENWKFELKVIPRGWGVKISNVDRSDADGRIDVADRLRGEGHADESFLIYWIAIGVSLRRLLGIAADRDMISSTLIREAYEEGVIDHEELRELEVGLSIRNRIVHGTQTNIPEEIGDSVQNISKALKNRTRVDSEAAP